MRATSSGVVLGLLLALLFTTSQVVGGGAMPSQIHLAFGHDPTTQMVVMWSMPNASTPIVSYGVMSGTYLYQASGTSWQFTQGNPNGLQWMNRVVLDVRLLLIPLGEI